MRTALEKVVNEEHLSVTEAYETMRKLMDGELTDAQIGALLIALRMKGETVDEIIGFAKAMRDKATRLSIAQGQLLDTCGTGGDGAKTFNVSTAAALVAAAGGVRVAKHGNRAVSSRSGSADVLEALGVRLQVERDEAKRCLEQTGLCFLFAPLYHQALKHALSPRREIGLRTVFNLLGPLTNPAGADRQVLGVYDTRLVEPIAHVLHGLGLKRALVVASRDGLDEVSISAPTWIAELKEGQVYTYEITPEEVGIPRQPIEAVAGGDVTENAQILLRVFQGEERGAAKQIIVANAGAAFYVTGRTPSIRDGVEYAQEVIESGKALAKLQQFITVTKECAHV